MNKKLASIVVFLGTLFVQCTVEVVDYGQSNSLNNHYNNKGVRMVNPRKFDR